MEYTLAEAAEAARVNRSTLLRAVKSGKLSARRLDDRSYRVDPSELSRVYSLHKHLHIDPEALPEHAQVAQGDAQALAAAVELAELRVKVGLLERERETHQETIADLRKRLDQEQEERRNLQRQLVPPAAEKPVGASSTAPAVVGLPEGPNGFLARLLSRRG